MTLCPLFVRRPRQSCAAWKCELDGDTDRRRWSRMVCRRTAPGGVSRGPVLFGAFTDFAAGIHGWGAVGSVGFVGISGEGA